MRRASFWLVIAFVFTVPWEAAIQIGAFGRGSRALGLVAAGAWVVSVVLRGRIRRLDPFVTAFLLFLIWNGLTLFWSMDPTATFDGFVTYTQIFGMILILWDLFETEREIDVALQALVLGAYVSCASIIVNWLTLGSGGAGFQRRIDALGFKLDGIAMIVASAIPTAWYLATRPGVRNVSRGLRAANFAYAPVGVFALILTGTRGAALASIPTLIFILWTLRATAPSRRFVAWVMVGTAIAAVLLFAPDALVERITGAGADIIQGDTLSGRTEIWADGVDIFMEHPFAGVGLDAFPEASAYGKEAHNTALSVLGETGSVGFLLFCFVVLIAVVHLFQLRGWSAWFWRTQLAVLAVGSMSLHIENSKTAWIFMVLAVATAAAARAQRPIEELDLAAITASSRFGLPAPSDRDA